MESLTIHSHQGDYGVDFAPDMASLASRLSGVQRTVVVIDSKVEALYRGDLAPLLSTCPTLTLDATEDEKTLAGAARILDFLQKHNATKQSRLIALGGGIVQDVSTFAAHVYYRGLKWTFVPTTLLGMCDSCIGAKSGLNLNTFKNQIGVFHSPSSVLICTEFAKTLSDDDIKSGYGEIVKLMLIGGEREYTTLVRSFANGGFRNPDTGSLIHASLKVKQNIIEQDEYELDLRRILNYGHTFGHSLESITHNAIPHGIAVAFGVDIANHIAYRWGLLDERWNREIHEFVDRYYRFPLPPVTAVQLIDGARRDKKVADGKINLALLEQPGSLKIVPSQFDERLESAVADYLATSRLISSE